MFFRLFTFTLYGVFLCGFLLTVFSVFVLRVFPKARSLCTLGMTPKPANRTAHIVCAVVSGCCDNKVYTRLPLSNVCTNNARVCVCCTHCPLVRATVPALVVLRPVLHHVRI